MLHEMRPGVPPRRTGPTDWRNSSVPTRFAPTTARTMPLACCMRRCAARLPGDARGRLEPGSGRRRACRRPRRLLLSHHPGVSTHPLIEILRDEVALPPPEWDSVIVATGPLTSPALADAIGQITYENSLAFFDAIAPIVHRDSIDMDVAWFQSRYDKTGPGGSGADYINCPMDRTSTRPSSRRCSPATRPPSRNGKRPRRISTDACRSR